MIIKQISKLTTMVLLSVILFTACTMAVSQNEEKQQAAPNITTPAENASQDTELLEEEQNLEETFIRVEEFVIGLLLVAALVSIGTQRLRIPYTVGLVLVGLALTFIQRMPIANTITPELILALLVPPLIFEAAFHLNFSDLRRDMVLILFLAVPGVLVTTILVGTVVALGASLDFSTALIFGSLVAATDPVAVIALFRSMGVPKRLQVLLEGESLLNDGTAIVVFSLMLAIAGITPLRIVGTTVSLDGPTGLIAGVIAFLIVSGGGLLVGAILGFLISNLIRRIDDYLIEITLTTVLAYGAYLIAEEVFHVSGVLAVVAAGLASGNTGPKGMSPTTRIVLFNFWEYAAFLANSFVFLLIGLEIKISLILENWVVIVWAIVAVLAARAVSVYSFSWIGREVPAKWKHILYWGGLRGAISLALALSLSSNTPNRDQLQAMAFGVVLFTLLVKGLSMGPLIRRMGLIQYSEAQQEYERRHAMVVATRSALQHLEKMHQEGLLSEYSWQLISPALEKRSRIHKDAVRNIVQADPSLRAEEVTDAWREALRVQRSELSSLFRIKAISEDIFSELVSEVDAALDDPEGIWAEISYPELLATPIVDLLSAAIVQFRDSESATSALERQGFSVTRLPSIGGFLGHTNVTLLIGLQKGKEEVLVQTLQESCQERVEYLASPVEGSPLRIATPVTVSVGSATIFTFDVEQYEEF